MAFLCFLWFRSLMGGWYLLVYSYSFSQLKIKILLTLLTYLYNVYAEGYKQLSTNSTYVAAKNYKNELLVDLPEKSNKIFKKLLNKKVVTEKKLKYFTYNFKNASWLGKMYLFTKIHKRRMQRFRAPSNL